MNNSELAAYNKKRRIFQIGIVTADLDAALQAWVEVYKVGPWTVFTHSDEVLTDIRSRSDACGKKFKFRCALAMVGDLQIEIIQPLYGLPIYEEFLARTGGGVHHIKEKLTDEEMTTRMDEYMRMGMDVLFAAKFSTSTFAYPDTQNRLGIFVEIGNCEKARLPENYPHRSVFPSE